MTELSARLGSTPVVMFYLNVPSEGLVPESAEKVADIKREPVDPTAPSGRKLCEGKIVDMRSVLREVEKRGYVPTRFLSVARFQGISHRMVLVCVLKDCITEGDEAGISEEQRSDFNNLLCRFRWDSRVYRNPGENGGNFIIESGNPKPAKDRRAESLLRIDPEEEFEIVRNDEERKAKERNAEARRIARELLANLS